MSGPVAEEEQVGEQKADRLNRIKRDFWEASHDPDDYINGGGTVSATEANYALDLMCQRFADLAEIARRALEEGAPE